MPGSKSLIKIIFLLLILAGFLADACRKIEQYPPEPWIEFKDFEKILDTTLDVYNQGILKFKFTDGDGNIGLDEGDTFPPFNPGSRYYYNLIIDYYEIRNGIETLVPLVTYNSATQEYDTISLSARVPLLIPKEIKKPISGDIYDTLFIYNFNSTFDTLLLKFRLVDRELNESNEASTGIIVRKL